MRTSYGVRRLVVAASALTALPMIAGAQGTLRRSAAGGDNAPTTTAISSTPYAGRWEGTFHRADQPRDAQATRIAMSFAVSNAATQSYSGETMLDAAAPSAHLNFAAVPVDARRTDATQVQASVRGTSTAGAAAGGGGGAMVRRRSPDGADAPTGGPSPVDDGSALRSLQFTDGSALFVMGAGREPLLCDTGRRCAPMPVLRWEEKDASGAVHAYSAQLVGANEIAGTVRRPGSDAPVGRFMLRRVP